ncbi:hypothetical protein CDAR_401461 [Caerostris darwini]|uniref:AMMECR1 domain-containing protein n=1 Tax=Caerostris darwini TaxID=1538125 RepID=A0AAV4TYW6_9ARAC|nr:hypothetical protein CDAR_401421 [Caerostris darwini]GIY50991.1 hypothetical protein CDAR_401461 [Caerostris darwini]
MPESFPQQKEMDCISEYSAEFLSDEPCWGVSSGLASVFCLPGIKRVKRGLLPYEAAAVLATQEGVKALPGELPWSRIVEKSLFQVFVEEHNTEVSIKPENYETPG